MLASFVLLFDLRMAGTAVNLLRNGFARPPARRVNPAVTLAAAHPCVTRPFEFHVMHDERLPRLRGYEIRPAVAAHAVGIRHPLIVEHPAGLVRLVAIDARGKNVRFLFPQFPAYQFPVNSLNLDMAFRARRRNVLPRNRRTRIRVWQNGVGRVA